MDEPTATLGSRGLNRPAWSAGTARKAGPRFDQAALTRFAHWYLERWAASRAMLEAALQRRCAKAVRAELLEREAAAELIAAVLASLSASGLVRDDLYAHSRAGRLARRGKPRGRIAADLANRGIDPATAAQALDEAGVDDIAAAKRYAKRRRLGPHRLDGRAEHRSRDLAALARAGFTSTAAHAAIDGDDA